MISNNGSALLLAWVNRQRSEQGQNTVLYDFSNLKDTGFAYELLQQVHPTYFAGLNHVCFDINSYLGLLEEYLTEVEGKKIARAYKKEVVEAQSIEEVIKVVLFLLLQSDRKGEFISRIVEMSVQVQSYLMEEIKRVKTSVQNFVEIKDILFTVERLEEENEALKEKLKMSSQINEQLNQNVVEFKNEKAKIQREVRTYENEKKQVFEELQVLDLKEYIEIYRLMKQENDQLNNCIQDIEESKKEVESENQVMKERIHDDFHTIGQLNDRIVNLKSSYVVMKEEMSCLSTINDSFEENVLRENKNFGNVKVGRSLESCCSQKNSLFLSHTFDDEENSQNDRLRTYNTEILHKLDSAYKTITSLTAEVTTFKEDKVKLEKKNVFLEKKLGDLKKQQNRFMKELKKMGL